MITESYQHTLLINVVGLPLAEELDALRRFGAVAMAGI
jgi:hypothetical protein